MAPHYHHPARSCRNGGAGTDEDSNHHGLFARIEGRYCRRIFYRQCARASDTVIGGHFTLTIPVEELAKSYLFLRGEGCPNHLMTIWLKPGVDVKVTGKDCLYPLWKVESPLQDLRPQDAGELGGLVSVMPSLLEHYRTYAQS